MGIIHRYITGDFVVSLLMTVAIFTFVMTSAAFFKMIDLMARGLSGMVILKVFLLNMPYILTFAIPMGVMTTGLLLFSRLSFDGELTALRAGGVSLWQMVAPMLVVSIALSFLCIYLNSFVAPNSRFARERVLYQVGATEPMSLIDEGRFVNDFPGLKVYVGKKYKNRIADIVVYETGPKGVKKCFRAKTGEVRPELDKGKFLMIDLYDVRIEQPDQDNPLDPSANRTVTAEKYPVRLDVSEALTKAKVDKNTKDQTTPELLKVIRNTEDFYLEADLNILARNRTKKLVEANKRVVLAFSSFAFLLLAIPLGMKSRRKESSAGIGISLLVILIFYSFIILAESTVKYPAMHPEILIWIPVLVAEGIGFYLLKRVN